MTGLSHDSADRKLAPAAEVGTGAAGPARQSLFGAIARLLVPEATVAGSQVVLRPPRRGDWRAWSSLRGQSREFLEPWEPVWEPDHLTKRTYQRRLRLHAQDRSVLPFFIFSKSTGALLGGITLNNIRRGFSQSCTLGYWMGVPYARQGFMFDALGAVAGYAFDVLDLHRLEAACLPRNEASRALLEKLAFRHEGRARRLLKIAGRWEDHVVYALLASDPRP